MHRTISPRDWSISSWVTGIATGDSGAGEPIPSDRDQALVRYDGLLLHVARERAAPQLVKFGDNIPVVGLTWNGRDLDRMILPRINRTTLGLGHGVRRLSPR
jgi:hypothetical protein